MTGEGFPSSPHMARALALARKAAASGEVPVGAVVVGPDGRVLGEGHNQTRSWHDPTGHAEVIALREAAQALQNERLLGCTLWVTLEPCPMCASAIAEARVARLVYGASDPKGGGVEHGPLIFRYSRHQPEVISGIAEQESAEMLRQFFSERRQV